MPTQVADRLAWGYLESDINDFSKWALNNDIAHEVVAFLRWKPELLSAFDPKVDVCPSPRSWEGVSDLVKEAQRLRAKGILLPLSVEQHGYAGVVGEGAAIEFMGFLQVYRDLPDPAAMLLNPATCQIPTEPSVLCALCAVLAKKATDANMQAIVTIANRLLASQHGEFSVLLVTQAVGLNAKLSNTRAFVEWATRNQHVLV